ncbi:hypothetical protein GCM10023225_22780 [Kineococcus glutinatus]|uniref:Uncharacterized protein n=1 Tax=Kineococcus glutinatus TaxID=1070872 RepID=A0ABP9HYW1_9ACTN
MRLIAAPAGCPGDRDGPGDRAGWGRWWDGRWPGGCRPGMPRSALDLRGSGGDVIAGRTAALTAYVPASGGAAGRA